MSASDIKDSLNRAEALLLSERGFRSRCECVELIKDMIARAGSIGVLADRLDINEELLRSQMSARMGFGALTLDKLFLRKSKTPKMFGPVQDVRPLMAAGTGLQEAGAALAAGSDEMGNGSEVPQTGVVQSLPDAVAAPLPSAAAAGPAVAHPEPPAPVSLRLSARLVREIEAELAQLDMLAAKLRAELAPITGEIELLQHALSALRRSDGD